MHMFAAFSSHTNRYILTKHDALLPLGTISYKSPLGAVDSEQPPPFAHPLVPGGSRRARGIESRQDLAGSKLPSWWLATKHENEDETTRQRDHPAWPDGRVGPSQRTAEAEGEACAGG